MPQVCTVCRHVERAAIDAALLAGGSLRGIAGQYQLGKSSLERRKADHLPEPMIQAAEQAGVDHGIDLHAQLRAANSLAWQVAKQARDSHDGELALKALDRVLRQLTLVAELAEQIDRRPTVNILVDPGWLRVRDILVAALEPWPDARSVIAARLLALEANSARSN